MPFTPSDEWMIPVEPGQSVDSGWTAPTSHRPMGITWHWTASLDLARCDQLLGGANAERRGVASAHYGIGRSFAEGVHRYVSLENRSWHAGKNQLLRWDGGPYDQPAWKGARTTVGVETVNIGYARSGYPSEGDWILAWSPNGRQAMRVQPWTEEQMEMMVAVGREILERWPHIGPRDHHGHHDLCPTYKVDVSGFPFADLLRQLYDDPTLPDVWTPFWTLRGRFRALLALGEDLAGEEQVGRWGPASEAALRRVQQRGGLVENGYWTTFVNWHLHDLFAEQGRTLAEVVEA